MDLQTLRVFAIVAREGNLTRAAERLCLTQPAVSLQIKKLQEHTQLSLFRRTPRGLEMTRYGEALLPMAERVIACQRDFITATTVLRNETKGLITIGTILDPQFTRLGPFLGELLNGRSGLEVSLRHGISGEILSLIAAQDLDAGFYLRPPPGAFDGSTEAECEFQSTFFSHDLTTFTYRVVGPAGWQDRITGRGWKDLVHLPWLSTPADSVHHRLLSRIYGPNSMTGAEPTWVAKVDQESSMIEIIKSGTGLSLVREHLALREAEAHGLTIADEVSAECVMSFVFLRARLNDPILKCALNIMRRIWEPLCSDSAQQVPGAS